VQLLVQAFAATSGLVEGAMRRLAASADRDPRPSTREVLLATLREEPPVPFTRRIAPDGSLVVLRLDGPDADADTRDAEPRTLAFGSGPRSCPAPHHALAIATAIVEELHRRAAAPASARAPEQADETGPDFDAEERTDADAR
jgi:cytochrome P450